jgi:O-antigen ligase
LAATAQSPLTGYGLGAFEEIFRVVQTEAVDVNLNWRSAHSAPLEVLFESGFLVFLLPLAAFAFYAKSILKSDANSNPTTKIAALGILITGVLHGLFDNTLSTPGVGATFAACLGLASSTDVTA